MDSLSRLQSNRGSAIENKSWRGSQVVRRSSAKGIHGSSILPRASKIYFQSGQNPYTPVQFRLPPPAICDNRDKTIIGKNKNCPGGGMVYTKDLKSFARKGLRVRVSPRAQLNKVKLGSRSKCH